MFAQSNVSVIGKSTYPHAPEERYLKQLELLVFEPSDDGVCVWSLAEGASPVKEMTARIPFKITDPLFALGTEETLCESILAVGLC